MHTDADKTLRSALEVHPRLWILFEDAFDFTIQNGVPVLGSMIKFSKTDM